MTGSKDGDLRAGQDEGSDLKDISIRKIIKNATQLKRKGTRKPGLARPVDGTGK